MKSVKIYWIDLFCGAGGTTTGIHLSNANAEVIACVNHDAIAIASHKLNHPDCLHLTEDIRDFKVVSKIKVLVTKLRRLDPDCIINIWASLECTNYSKAKGGLPRDADSRTLAEHLFMYLRELNPDYLYIENVREFMAWGPLDDQGKPISSRNGSDYMKWVNTIKSYGFNYDYKLLNAADFGAYTSRERYFGQFAKKGFPVSWPESTHVKRLSNSGMFPSEKKQWKPVKEVLDLNDEGQSIFTRKKPLSENTLKRIYAGILKFVANGEKEFIKKYYSGRPHGKVTSLKKPLGTVTTVGNQALVQSQFLSSYYGNGTNRSINKPAPTITTKDRFAKIESQFIDQQYGNSKPHDLLVPINTITTNPKQNLVTTKSQHYIMNPQFNNKGGSIEKPSPTIIARQDKKPLYLIRCDYKKGYGLIVYDQDSEMTIKIKEFMAIYGLVDIKMRMLRVDELLRIQGFPEDYRLKGTKTIQKKFIGNSVVPVMSQKLVEANSNALVSNLNKVA